MGRFLFVTEINGVTIYAINTNFGALSPLAGSPFPAGTSPTVVSVDPTDRYVYALDDGSANISQFALESFGALTPLGAAAVPVGNDPSQMTIVRQ